MTTLLCLVLSAFIITPSLSQTDASSFAITTSSNSASGTNAIVILTLSWNMRQYQCTINASSTNGIQPDSSYGCSLYTKPKAEIISEALTTNQYSMKIEVQGNTSDSIRFAGIRVVDEDSNYYDIDSFCLPSQFSNTAAASINIRSLKCCYWSQRQKYFEFAMGNKQTASLLISYVEFRTDVLNHKNEPHEGAVKPPKITTLGIKTLSTDSAGSTSKINLKLHWDTDEYVWNNLIPKDAHTTYQTSFSTVSTSCPFLTGFNLQISRASDTSDNFGIDSIIVVDESDYHYQIETFCASNSVDSAAKYSSTDTTCSMQTVDIIRDPSTYNGFIYNGNGSVYFVWDDSLFMNVNEDQEAFVTNDYIILTWLHSSTCNDMISPYSKVTIDKNDMSNAASTGWIFSGNHDATATAVNCPGGILDSCARLGGGGSMQYSLSITDYINIHIQYEMRLSSMPAGKRCYLHYAFDNGAFKQGQYRQSTSTIAVLYRNESFSVPDHLINGYSTLTIKFSNDGTDDTDYCWFDNFYVFGDYLIQYDNCNNSNDWNLHSTSFSTNVKCPDSMCLPLITNNAYAIKTYSNIQYYRNIALTIDVQIDSQLLVYYFYDSEQTTIILPTVVNDTKQIFDIPYADICATTLYIKFMTTTNSESYIDNIKLSGIILKTLNPTVSPTLYPTNAPTIPTMQPTFDPTLEPTIPTTEPTTEPTIPTHMPTIQGSKVGEKGSNNSSNMVTTIVVIFVVVIVFVVILIVGWWYYNKRKMTVPGADLDEPLLLHKDVKNDNDGNVKSIIELNVQQKYDMNNIGHPIPGSGVVMHREGGRGEQQLPENIENDSDATGSIMGDQFMADEMKEAEIIGAINETPQ